jgi:hypothetical protein
VYATIISEIRNFVWDNELLSEQHTRKVTHASGVPALISFNYSKFNANVSESATNYSGYDSNA